MRLGLLLAFGTALSAQGLKDSPPDLWMEVQQLSQAMDSGDWQQAARHSSRLEALVIAQRDSVLRGASAERINQVLSWLPTDTETIVVAQQPFKLVERDQNVEPAALAMAQGYVLHLLAAGDEGRFLKPLEGSTIRFSVVAARNFAVHQPDKNDSIPLGMIAWEGCAVYGFATPIPAELFPKQPDTVIAAHQVWTTTGKDYDSTETGGATERSGTYLATLLQPDELLACNDRGFFSWVLDRLSASTKGSQFESWPEWKQVDRSAPLWGMRHLRAHSAESDPTDIRTGGMLGFTDDKAIGITLQVGGPGGKVQARLLTPTTQDPWADLAANPEFGSGGATQRVGAGVWEYSCVDEHGFGARQIFALMAIMGFMVLV